MSEPRAIDVPLHLDARGWLMATDRAFEGMNVAYAYPTCCFPGVVKAWHRHREHTDRLWCVSGMARVVICQLKSWAEDELLEAVAKQEELLPEGQRFKALEDWPYVGRDFQEFVIGPLSPKVVVIPPGWWHGFTPVGNEPCVIVNAPDMPYDPGDEERLAIGAIPFPWREVDG